MLFSQLSPFDKDHLKRITDQFDEILGQRVQIPNIFRAVEGVLKLDRPLGTESG